VDERRVLGYPCSILEQVDERRALGYLYSILRQPITIVRISPMWKVTGIVAKVPYTLRVYLVYACNSAYFYPGSINQKPQDSP